MPSKKLYSVIAVTLIVLVFSSAAICNSCSADPKVLQETSNKNEDDKIAEEIIEGDTIEEDDYLPEPSFDFDKKYDVHFGIGGSLYPDMMRGTEAMVEITHDLDKLGNIWLRHPGRGTSWYEVQEDRNSWDWSKLDAVLEENRHPFLFTVYGMIGNPYPFGGDFNQDHLESLGGKEEIMDYIKEHELDMDDPQQREDAMVYVKTFVNRYKNRIKYWEIGGNEGIASSHRLGIMKYTYQWIKEVQPEAVVLMTAVGGDDNEQFFLGLEAFDRLLSEGAGDYFDIANFHYYEHFSGDFEERLEDRYDGFKDIMDRYGIDKPIWVTETSTSSFEGTVLSEPSDEELQAIHVVIRNVVFTAKGTDKVFWYNYSELTEGDKFYGCNLVEKGSPKPGYYNLKLLIDKIGYYEKVETIKTDPLRLYRFINKDGEQVFIAWADSETVIDLSAFSETTDVFVTYSIIDDSTKHTVETMSPDDIIVDNIPVFIEFKK